MRTYADTNFLVPLYLDIGSSKGAESFVAAAVGMRPLPMTPLLLMEALNAFQLHLYVSRTQGQWRVSPEATAAATADFIQDIKECEIFETEILDWDALQKRVEDLSLRHTARHGFRTYDLIHVASAQLLGCSHFWSFDQKARNLALVEGLKLNSMGEPV
jgi:predicted nucleic acid-binding protein